jgi:hypothetical protein
VEEAGHYRNDKVRFEVPTVMSMKMTVIWDTLMMEAASTSETSVNFYETTRRCIPGDRNLHITDSLTTEMIMMN